MGELLEKDVKWTCLLVPFHPLLVISTSKFDACKVKKVDWIKGETQYHNI
jgi:hypothetical protein